MVQKVAAIYDIHGNVTALQAVLQEIEKHQVDLIIVGGDLVWGPEPLAVMEELFSLKSPARFIRGNADREVVGRYGIDQGQDEMVAEINQWCADQLSADHLRFLRDLPEHAAIELKGLGEAVTPISSLTGISAESGSSIRGALGCKAGQKELAGLYSDQKWCCAKRPMIMNERLNVFANRVFPMRKSLHSTC